MIGDLLGLPNGQTFISGPGSTPILPLLYNMNPEACVYLISDVVNSMVNDTTYSNNTLCVLDIGQYPYGAYVS